MEKPVAHHYDPGEPEIAACGEDGIDTDIVLVATISQCSCIECLVALRLTWSALSSAAEKRISAIQAQVAP